MPAKPLNGLGLVLGLVLGYVDIVVASYAAYRMAIIRQVRFDSSVSHSLQWLALLLVVALVTGLLMAPRRIGAGVMTGAGVLMTLAGLLVQLLPMKNTADLAKLFEMPGSRFLPYLLLDGSVLFMGLVFLVAGIGRWIADAKVVKQSAGPGHQPMQWGGYQDYVQQNPPYAGQYQQQPQYPGQPPTS